MKSSLLTSVALAISLAGLSQAGILTDLVDVQAQDPTIGAVYVDAGVATVNGTVEYPAGSFSTYNPTWSMELTDTQIILSGSGFPFASDPFNGFAITFLTGSITGASADASSQFNPLISIVGNTLYLNYTGVTGDGLESSIVDVTGSSAAIPEPRTFALVVGGLLASYFLHRVRRPELKRSR